MGKKADKRKLEKAIRQAVQATYEGASPSRMRKFRRESSSKNNLVATSARPLREQIRYLERNHDLARGALRTLVNNVVGPNGIGIEPQPRKKGSTEIHEAYAAKLRELYRDWQKRPEVTWSYRWAQVQRIECKTWLRDGEAFAQMITGNATGLDHGSKVPFSLELLEPDMIPLDYDDLSQRIRQGIKVSAWGRPLSFFVYKVDPMEAALSAITSNMKEVPAERMLHLASTDRIGQLRGVSEFASIITRLEDIKDYEESERVAAKIAAMLTAYIKRGSPELYDQDTEQKDANGNIITPEINLQAGTIIDSLKVGEEIGLIDSKRPNPNLITFRQGQLRAMAAGVGASYSSISRDYNGTYSAQRQELVEQWVHYAVLTDEFVSQFVQPTWEHFVLAAHLSGAAPIPRDVEPGTHDDALFIGQSMPWIDPVREATAWTLLVKAGFASEVEVMRKRGVNPMDVLEQLYNWREKCKEKGLVFDSNFANEVIQRIVTETPEEETTS
jgi:lambda family phage portal protein